MEEGLLVPGIPLAMASSMQIFPDLSPPSSRQSHLFTYATTVSGLTSIANGVWPPRMMMHTRSQ